MGWWPIGRTGMAWCDLCRSLPINDPHRAGPKQKWRLLQTLVSFPFSHLPKNLDPSAASREWERGCGSELRHPSVQDGGGAAPLGGVRVWRTHAARALIKVARFIIARAAPSGARVYISERWPWGFALMHRLLLPWGDRAGRLHPRSNCGATL
jgi:hypothetical protein